MRIELQGYEGKHREPADLGRFIPSTSKGKVLNYGQGEGQIEIDGTVWGIYYGRKENYYLQYEEGSLEPKTFTNHLQKMIDHLSSNITSNLKIDGIHERDPNV